MGEQIESPQPDNLADGLEPSAPDVHASVLIDDGSVFETVGDARAGCILRRCTPGRHLLLVATAGQHQFLPVSFVGSAQKEIFEYECHCLFFVVVVEWEVAVR